MEITATNDAPKIINVIHSPKKTVEVEIITPTEDVLPKFKFVDEVSLDEPDTGPSTSATFGMYILLLIWFCFPNIVSVIFGIVWYDLIQNRQNA